MSTSKVWKWGIIGTGRIAADFIGAIGAVEGTKAEKKEELLMKLDLRLKMAANRR